MLRVRLGYILPLVKRRLITTLGRP